MFGRIMNSFGGAALGLILFFSSFGILYWNEGRPDFSKFAQTAVIISAQDFSLNANLQGKLVAAEGKITTDEKIGDNYLKPGKYLAFERKAEMYAWIESKDSNTTEAKYSYNKAWVINPKDSTHFKITAGHFNPPMQIRENSDRINTAKLGAYSLNINDITLPQFVAVDMLDRNVVVVGRVSNHDYLYLGRSPSNPQIGDIKISYKVVESGKNATVFGKLAGGAIIAYPIQGGTTLYRIFHDSPKDAIATMHSEFVFSLWGLRVMGFLMMWAGFFMILNPISAILGIVPFARDISQWILQVITFFFAVIFTVVTVLVSTIAHNIILLFLVALLGIGSLVMYLKTRVGKKTN
ncbi:MAG: TMEM43 family protein [Candidatus Margulisiibacteriota bacterium]